MRRWLLLLSMLLPLWAGAEVRLTVGDIQVRGQEVFNHEALHGYTEYRLSVKNRSASQPHEVRIDFTFNQSSVNSTKTVTASPHARLSFSILVPYNNPSLRLMVTVDNRQMKESKNYFFSGRVYGRKASLLASKSINQDHLQQRIEALKGWTTNSKFNNEYTLYRTDLPPQEWSDDWRAYSSFDGVLLKHSDIELLPPNVLMALQQYVELGGILSVLGSDTSPFTGKTVQRLNSSTYVVGFGRCFVHTSNTVQGILQEVKAWPKNQKVFNILNDSETRSNKKFPLVDRVSVPVRGFLLLVTLFALIVGPVTVVVLAKVNRRIWLLWMVPIESAITCGLVLGYSFFSEGITPKIRMEGITLLDQERHVATTLGWLGCYCPQRPANGLFFSDDWELNRLKNNYRTSTTIDWTQKQHLSRGWVSARVPSFFLCRRSAIRRERLEYSLNDEGQIEVVNGLGAKINKLWFRDAKGVFYFAENIKAGQRTELTVEKNKTGSADMKALYALFTEDFPEAKNRLRLDPRYHLIPGSYIALLEGDPFMEHGLGDRRIKLKASATVYGLLPSEEQP